MLKSVLSLFGSLGGMILRVIIVIASLVGMLFFGVTAFNVPFRWTGALYLLGCVICAGLFVWLVRPRREDEEDREPPEEDRYR